MHGKAVTVDCSPARLVLGTDTKQNEGNGLPLPRVCVNRGASKMYPDHSATPISSYFSFASLGIKIVRHQLNLEIKRLEKLLKSGSKSKVIGGKLL